MAEFINRGETIEGVQCEIYTRKEEWKGLRKNPITEQTMMVYELDRNCSAEITKELWLSEQDKKIRDNYENRNNVIIHRNIGDKIKGDAITIYVNSKRKLPVESKEGMTSTHGGRLISTSKHTIGIIKYPFDNYKKLLGLSANSEHLQIRK